MSGTKRFATGWVAPLAVAVALAVAACGPASRSTTATANGQERMPSFASIWITSEPAVPTKPVTIELTSPQDPSFHRTHTFQIGEELRGSIPVSSGHYLLVGLGGLCAFGVFLGPERETDVVIGLGADGGCAFSVVREHGEEVFHDGSEVLID